METVTKNELGMYAHTENHLTVKGWGATGALIGGEELKPMDIERNPPGMDEVLIEVLYCGVCHSDIHQVANDWKNTIYPCVPGHEIIGKVVGTGASVRNFSVGDVIGVGCMIDSCRECHDCQNGEEQFCSGPHGATMTYNGYWVPDKDHFNTFGGYSTHIVAKESFVLRIPEGLDISAAAPILCAGVTTYSPLNHWGVSEGDKVGIIGIGGLGHMAVMIARAMGAEVTAFTSKEEKRSAAAKLGAHHVVITENRNEMMAIERSLDYLLCTIPESFDINSYICLLKSRGEIITVGLLGPYKAPTDNMEVAKLSRKVGGSVIGGIAETQEVLEFCAQHGIQPKVEMIGIQEINAAFKKIKEEEVQFRYVIDMNSLK